MTDGYLNDRISVVDPLMPVSAACFLCANTEGNFLTLRARHVDVRRSDVVDVAKCGSCESLFFPDLEAVKILYPAAGTIADEAGLRITARHYIELVGGLDWKVPLLEQIVTTNVGSVLEVGCSFGLQLDYCRRMWDADVVGLEPSEFGNVGRELLGLPIYTTYLHETPEIDGRTFDVVYAIEVLEHVDDPDEFLRQLRAKVAAGGVLMLTTPRASAPTDDLPLGERYAALSAGAHNFLASERQLELMLRNAGFAWCHIEHYGMTQFVVAAAQVVPVGPRGHPYGRMTEYYRKRLDEATSDLSSDRASGAAFDPATRCSDLIHYYCASRTNWGERDVGVEIEIERLLDDVFSVRLSDLDQIADEIAECSSVREVGARISFQLPMYVYWRCHCDDMQDRERSELLASAGRIAAHCVRIDPVHMFVYSACVGSIARLLEQRPACAAADDFAELVRSIPELGHVTRARVRPGLRQRWVDRLARTLRRQPHD